MRFAVVGTGGVGGYFGGRLAQAGHDTHFIARGEHLAAIRTHGLRVESILGDFVIESAAATDDPSEVGEVDVVIVAVKTWQLPEAAEGVRPLVGPGTLVLPLLNGVDASRILAEALGAAQVLGGLCRIAAEIAEPGIIRHSAIDPSIILGELDNRSTARVEALTEALRQAGVQAEIAPDIQAAIWEKFMLIATWSGIGAVTRVPVGRWRVLAGPRSMAEACLREILEVARAQGVLLEDGRVGAILEAFDAVPPASLASMQRDVMNGRPSELEAQTGAVVRLGAEKRVQTPTNTFLYYSLLPQEVKARER